MSKDEKPFSKFRDGTNTDDNKPFSKFHQKVADMLGMPLDEDEDEVQALVVIPVPDASEITLVENPELPDLNQELIRLEHGQRQGEILLEKGEEAVIGLLKDLALTPPIYKGRVAESAAELYKAVSDLNKHKVKSQIEIIELKLKLAAFTKNKAGVAAPQTITGNTIIFNREELIKQFGNHKFEADDEGDD